MRAGNAAGEPLTYFRNLVADIAARSETAMSQRHAFAVCRLALEAQAKAAWLPAKPRA